MMIVAEVLAKYLEPDYITRKPIIHRFQRCTMRTEILPTFHTRVKYISQHHFAHSNKCGRKCRKMPETMPETAPSLEARGPYLIHHIWMPGPTPLTTPNDSLIAVRTSRQLCNKVPIGYNGTPYIHPENCPFSDDHHQNLIHPFLDWPLSPPQRASRSNQSFRHNTLLRTDRWGRRMFRNISAALAVLIESDTLIIASK